MSTLYPVIGPSASRLASSFGMSLLDDANASAARSTLGLVIGTDVAAQSSLASYLPLAGGVLTASGPGSVPLTVEAAASQTADLFLIRNSSGSTLLSVNSAGTLLANTVGGNFRFKGNSTDETDGALFANSSGDMWFSNWNANRGWKVLANGGVVSISASGLLSIGGATSAFPAFKRSGAAMHCRLADDSADATFQAQDFKVAGTKVLGAQGSAVADPTGGVVEDVECRAQLAALLAEIRTHGLIAT